MVEDTQLVSTDNETEEEAEVETLARIPVGENVRLPGSDVRRGDNVMLSGDKITGRGGEVGSLVFVGREKVCFLSFGTPRSCSVDEMST
jgi:gephyrin